MSVSKPAREAIAVTQPVELPRPRVTRGELWANIIVGGALGGVLFLGAVGILVTQ